jgi:hypothetical protein
MPVSNESTIAHDRLYIRRDKSLNNFFYKHFDLLHSIYHDVMRGGAFNLGSAQTILTPLGINDGEVLHSFSNSKMTVLNELGEGFKYFEMQYEEFLEMLTHIAISTCFKREHEKQKDAEERHDHSKLPHKHVYEFLQELVK